MVRASLRVRRERCASSKLPTRAAQGCVLIYRAHLKTQNLEGKAYLEMWCRLPGLGEFFSRGLDSTVTGTTDWATYETPFFLKKGQRPDLVNLNLVVEGKGTVEVKDVELLQSPLPAEPGGNANGAAERLPVPAGKPAKIKSFNPPDKLITQDSVSTDRGAWRLESGGDRTFRLFEVTPKDSLEQSMLTYQAQMKTENVQGRAHLEMWCRCPGLGEAFSKGFGNALKGTSDWTTVEIPFFLEKGQQLDLIKLNVVVEGKGTVWLKNVELLRTPLKK